MRVPALATAALIAVLAGGPAAAECRGTDLLAGLAQSAPDVAGKLDKVLRDTPFAEGLLWKVEKGGRVSYVFGTWESTDPLVAAVPDRVRGVLGDVRTLLVESAPEEEERFAELLASDPDYILDPRGRRISDELESAEMDRLGELLGAFGIDRGAADTMAPWFLNLLLSAPACALAEIAADAETLDDLLLAAAEAEGVRVRGLEKIEDTLAAFQDASRGDDIRLLRINLALSEMSDDMAATLDRVWLDEKAGLLVPVNRTMIEEVAPERRDIRAAEAFLRRVVEDRTAAWMKTLRADLGRGRVLLAVGAYHLPGEDGILAQLEADGFSVTRVALTDTAPEPAKPAEPAPAVPAVPAAPAEPEKPAEPAPAAEAPATPPAAPAAEAPAAPAAEAPTPEGTTVRKKQK